jgi:hypothetical protein
MIIRSSSVGRLLDFEISILNPKELTCTLCALQVTIKYVVILCYVRIGVFGVA